jgi:type IV pilus assembly protein PilA
MKQQRGFTLIELAVVIAIVAILAAVAIPRLTDTTDAAEAAVFRDFKSQLVSAAAMFTARQGAVPTGFNQFVDGTNLAPAGNMTISTRPLNANCAVTAAAITCTGYRRWNPVTFNWSGGSINGTATANAAAGNVMGNLQF